MNLDSSIAFIATLVASGMQSIDMVFFCRGGQCIYRRRHEPLLGDGNEACSPCGGTCIDGA